MNKAYLLNPALNNSRPFAYITIGSASVGNGFIYYGFSNGGVSQIFGKIEEKSKDFPNISCLITSDYPEKDETSSFAKPAGYYERTDTGLGLELPNAESQLYSEFFTSADVGKTIKIYYGKLE